MIMMINDFKTINEEVDIALKTQECEILCQVNLFFQPILLKAVDSNIYFMLEDITETNIEKIDIPDWVSKEGVKEYAELYYREFLKK